MKPEKRNKFDIWYSQNQNRGFSLREALYEYGTNDTDILLLAIYKFRNLLMELTEGFFILFEQENMKLRL